MLDRARIRRSIVWPFALACGAVVAPAASAGEPPDALRRAGETLAGREAILSNQVAMARITTRWRARELYRFVRAGGDVGVADSDRGRVLLAGVQALAREQREQQLLAAELGHTASDRAALADAPIPGSASPRVGPPRLVAPATGPRRARFGAALDPATGAWFFRPGVRIGARPGDPVRAPAAGVVRRVADASAQGGALVIDHGGGWISILSGLAAPAPVVHAGSCVAGGQAVAQAGAAPDGVGFELWRAGTPVDPAVYVRF